MPPLIEAARKRGLHVILAGIDAENKASIRLHAAFGFVQVACLKKSGSSSGAGWMWFTWNCCFGAR